MVVSSQSAPLHRPQILIDHTEYDRLLFVETKYDSLCQNLVRGGVDTAAIELLSQRSNTTNDQNTSFDSSDGTDAKEQSSPTSTVVDYRGRSHYAKRSGQFYAVQRHEDEDELESDCESESPPESLVSHGRSSLDPEDSASIAHGHRSYERDARRTLQLNNLPLTTTHADIVGAIRGGPVIDIYINFKEHRAAVSFIHGQHAKNYYEFAQAFGVCIQNSKVVVSWSTRQFVLAPYVAQQIRGGASRNLVIRYCDRRITADSIREDLEHIHNLSVVSVQFSGLDCYIGTNSITAASFARTCMMSRFPYRGSRVEWAPDECMQSLDQLKRQNQATLPRLHKPASLNRFSLLDLDGA